MSISLRLLTVRLLPAVASLLLHAAACGAIMLAPGWVSVRESAILVELVEPLPLTPAPLTPAPEPAKPDRRPFTPPKLVRKQTPIPSPVPTQTPAPQREPVETAKPEPLPPSEPVTTPPTPEPTTAPAASDVADGVPTYSAPPPPAASAPPARSASPSVAALPLDGITQSAAPRGGYQVKPSYPSSARRAGIQGTTLLGVFIGADGRVGDIVVRESAGHPDLDAAAVDAVKRWRFEPARRGTEPVSMWVLLPVQFTLR